MSPIDWCCYCTHRLWLGFQRNINFIKRYTNSFLFIILYIIYIKLYIRRPRPTQGRARQGRRVSGNSKCHNSKTSYIQQQWRQYLEQQQQQRPAAPTTHACTYTHTHVYFPTWSLHPSPPSFSSASLPFPTSASSLFSIIIAPLQRPPCSGACMASTQGSTPSSGVSPATSCSPLTCAPTNAHALAHRHTDTHTQHLMALYTTAPLPLFQHSRTSRSFMPEMSSSHFHASFATLDRVRGTYFHIHVMNCLPFYPFP